MENADEIREKNRLEIKSTIIISLATLAIAWCSYQNTLWSGQQSFSLADANKYARNAKQEALMVAQRQQIDVAVTMNVLNAVLEKKNYEIEYYMKRGRPELSGLLQEWLKTDPLNNQNAPAHLMLMPEYTEYVKRMMAPVDSSEKLATLAWQEAKRDNNNADNYVLCTVMLSTVMFLGAIAPKLRNIRLSRFMVNASGLMLLLMLIIIILVMPVTTTGQ